MPLNILSFFSVHRWKIIAIAGIVTAAAAAWGGYQFSENRWETKFAEKQLAAQIEISKMREENLRLTAQAERVTIQTITRYVDRVRVVREAGEEIIREVPIYVTPEIDLVCPITYGFKWVHDSAAAGPAGVPPVSRAPDDVNATSATVKLSDIARIVAENYTKYHTVSERLHALQSWIRDQQKLRPAPVARNLDQSPPATE